MAEDLESKNACMAVFSILEEQSVAQLRTHYPEQPSAFETRVRMLRGLSYVRQHHDGCCSQIMRDSTLSGVYQVVALNAFTDGGTPLPVLSVSQLSQEELTGIHSFVSSLTSNLPH